MMGRKAARNMYSRNTNKTGIQCICWFYSQGIYSKLHRNISCYLQGSLSLGHSVRRTDDNNKTVNVRITTLRSVDNCRYKYQIIRVCVSVFLSQLTGMDITSLMRRILLSSVVSPTVPFFRRFPKIAKSDY